MGRCHPVCSVGRPSARQPRRGREPTIEADHQVAPRTAVRFDDPRELLLVEGEGLLHEHVLARVHGLGRQPRMTSVPREDEDEVDPRAADQLGGAGGAERNAVAPGDVMTLDPRARGHPRKSHSGNALERGKQRAPREKAHGRDFFVGRRFRGRVVILDQGSDKWQAVVFARAARINGSNGCT